MGAVGRTPRGIAWTMHGTGPHTLLLVHGVACTQAHFAGVVQALPPHWRCITLDLAGHGDSTAAAHDGRGIGIARFADDVAEVHGHAALDEVVLVGHSMGAAVCVEAAARLGGRVQHVVALDALLNPHLYPRRPAVVSALYRLLATPLHTPMTRAMVRGLCAAPGEPALVADVTRTMLATPREVTIRATASLVDWDRDAALARTDAPVTVIPAAAFLQQRNAEAVQPRCRVAPPIDGGHFFLLQDPVATARAIERTLDGGIATADGPARANEFARAP